MNSLSFELPAGTVGLRLCKVAGDDLVMCESIHFGRGRVGATMALRRAAISGAVGPLGETGDYWADVLEDGEDWTDTVALSREAWNALKNRILRCRIDRPQPPTKRPNPCRPRLVEIRMAWPGEEPGAPRYYAAPDDGRALEDILIGELRPWPAMDAAMMLKRVGEQKP